MAPEQLRGEEARPAADLWALAVIAHEMLTGSHPFAAAGLDGAPAVPSTLGVRASQFFAHALAINPLERPRSAVRLAEELAVALAS
jgi:serine/threonine protein kinase